VPTARNGLTPSSLGRFSPDSVAKTIRRPTSQPGVDRVAGADVKRVQLRPRRSTPTCVTTEDRSDKSPCAVVTRPKNVPAYGDGIGVEEHQCRRTRRDTAFSAKNNLSPGAAPRRDACPYRSCYSSLGCQCAPPSRVSMTKPYEPIVITVFASRRRPTENLVGPSSTFAAANPDRSSRNSRLRDSADSADSVRVLRA